MKKTICAIGLFLMTSLPSVTYAATVPPAYEKVGFLIGTDTFSDKFTVPVAGTYRATATDMGFPAPFTTLLFAVATTTEFMGGTNATGGQGQFTFEAQPGVTYFASLMGVAGGGLDIGMFGAEVALIPIPAAALLFASAIVSLLVVARRRGGAPEGAAAA